MSNSTSEREQRLKEIRAWAISFRPFRCVPENAALFEQDRESAHAMVIDLLSLLDSEAAGGDTDYKRLARELATIVDVATDDDPGTALSKLHKIQHAAATSMHSLCVEKVKQLMEYEAVNGERRSALIDAVRELQSLTLEQEQKTK